MKLARNLIQGASGGLVAGAVIGLVEALYLLATSGAPDLLSPLYAVLLYGAIGLPFGLVGGLVVTPIGRFIGRDHPRSGTRLTEGQAWTVGAAAATTPMALFILRYIVNKAVYLEQGVPLTGLLAIVAVVGIVDLALFFGLSRVLDRAKGLLTAPGLVGTYGGLVAVTGVVALLPTGSDPRSSWAHGKPVPPALADKPDVLLIMVDTLRADFLGTYGMEGDPSPAIDAFAADGIVFERGYAQASWTRASGASLLTARYPSGHNAALKAARLPDEVVTWSEVLQDGGVTTGALMNNINMTSTFNFDQGYDTFIYESPDYPFLATESVFGLTFYKVVHKVNEKLFGKHKRVEDYYQPADVVLADAKGFIEANRDSRWGLFVQLMEPHDPYFEHPSVDGSGTAHYNGVGFARAEVEHPSSDPENIEYLKRVYRDEITFMDKHLKAFFDWMKAEGIYDDTLIVLTSDHGEEFFEHGGWWHGTTLYDEQTHVPIVVKLPGNALAGTRVPWQVRSIDIVPTITSVLGLPPGEKWDGEDLLADVRAWLEEEAAEEAAQLAAADGEPAEVTDAEPVTDGSGPDGEVAPAVDPCASYGHPWDRTVMSEENFEGNVLFSLRRDGFRYSTANEGNPRGLPTEELFDVVADPGEQANLAGSDGVVCGQYHADRQTDLGEELQLVVKAAAAGASRTTQACLSAEERQKLIALGYMEAAEGDDPDCP